MKRGFSMYARAAAALALVASTAHAQLGRPRPAAPAADTTSARVDSRSPRAAIADFLSLTRRGQFSAAGRYMGSGESALHSEELARKLRAVFDQRLWLELGDISPLAVGDTTDGLPKDREQIGMIPSDAGVRQPVQLIRRVGAEPTWIFATSTVDRIDQWYDGLEDRWLRDHMPESLQGPGPFGN